MMFHTLVMCTYGLTVDGAAAASSMRADLIAVYIRSGAQIQKYASDGVTIMIDNGWMEQPPQSIRHEKLVTE